MKNKFFAAMLLAFSCALLTNAQEERSTDLSYLFPEPKSWDFGIQVNQGLERSSYSNFQGTGGFSQTDGITRLAFFAQYQINKNSNLKMELSAGLYYRLAPTISIQYGYQFAPRWTAYGGLAVEYAGSYNFYDSRENNPQYRSIMPRFQLGVRYQASKSIFIDLRYEGDILKRTQLQNLSTSRGRIHTVTLGMGIKF
ncbi:hypothetical protein JCM19275_885 [Nonlabens ulvanivorans]|uniref:Outer membrane protein beta-barrel domain-containing protein n=1 Tax=Nonlabens ulvanivorans TaxID=906888 RepID=A0A090WCZ9_NONUL|nr:hypothetical protein [Nonlabens ulvanivorans]GAL74846.1 hypothetical protein JCM19275_885 [Nonlabens ulvanivorans]